MIDYRQLERQFASDLGLVRRPIAMAMLSTPPAGVAKFEGTVPAGCTFWRMASEGRTFFTVPSDHYNCAIGAHTHNIPLPPDRAKELEATLSFMTGIGYVRMEEVADIPVLPTTPGAVVYAPWETRLSIRTSCCSGGSHRGSCCCRKPRYARGSQASIRLAARRAWPSPPRWRSEWWRAPAASAIVPIPALKKGRCTQRSPERSWHGWRRRRPPSSRRTHS